MQQASKTVIFLSKMNIEEILRKSLKLETSEACQGTDISTDKNCQRECGYIY